MKEEHRRDVRIAEIQTRAADLVDHVQEEFGVSLPDAAAAGTATIPENLDEKEARLEVADLRRSIRSLGAVNELALETYEEEKERLEFLTKQQEDLEKAEETLLETIKEINTTASERFMETFELIRGNFQRIFNSLFGSDAGADLVLEDPNDPLETAIDINARPRGKRPCGISQLSGGEKTLTAIALLFGIYLVKPSPFCILDEVDAPLDDANVERFMGLIREFATDIQFILVTHNKRTMEAADRLYGITMQETGVSRLVGVKFDEAVEIVDHASREAA
jgi:chromosome segregation protein